MTDFTPSASAVPCGVGADTTHAAPPCRNTAANSPRDGSPDRGGFYSHSLSEVLPSDSDAAAPHGVPTHRGGTYLDAEGLPLGHSEAGRCASEPRNPILSTSTVDMDALVAEITLAAHQASHAFLVHQGHTTSASQLEPLLRAAQHRVMSMGVQ